MNRQYESMTRAVVAGLTVRVWCEEKQFTSGPNIEVVTRLTDIAGPFNKFVAPRHAMIKTVAATLDAISNVSAYEILDEHGHGAIVYPDWK